MKVPGFDPVARGASEQEIEGAQLLLGVRFPEAYVELLASYSDAYGDADFSFPDSRSRGSVGYWISVSPWSSESLWAMLSSWSEHGLPQSVVPVAADGGGNLICLDFRQRGEPVVSAWFHELPGEDGLINVASSFAGFLSLLRAHEE